MDSIMYDIFENELETNQHGIIQIWSVGWLLWPKRLGIGLAMRNIWHKEWDAYIIGWKVYSFCPQVNDFWLYDISGRAPKASLLKVLSGHCGTRNKLFIIENMDDNLFGLWSHWNHWSPSLSCWLRFSSFFFSFFLLISTIGSSIYQCRICLVMITIGLCLEIVCKNFFNLPPP